MDALIEWINTHPEWVETINRIYRHAVINNVFMAVLSFGTFTTLILGITSLINTRIHGGYAIIFLLACLGFATCMVLLLMDRTDLYQSWSVAMA